MTPTLLAELIVQVGLPVAQQLFQLSQSGNKPLTPADFDELTKLSQYRSADALAAAGIKIVDGKVVPI